MGPGGEWCVCHGATGGGAICDWCVLLQLPPEEEGENQKVTKLPVMYCSDIRDGCTLGKKLLLVFAEARIYMVFRNQKA